MKSCQKDQFTGTATQPQRNRKFCQFKKDQYCMLINVCHIVLVVISNLSYVNIHKRTVKTDGTEHVETRKPTKNDLLKLRRQVTCINVWRLFWKTRHMARQNTVSDRTPRVLHGVWSKPIFWVTYEHLLKSLFSLSAQFKNNTWVYSYGKGWSRKTLFAPP